MKPNHYVRQAAAGAALITETMYTAAWAGCFARLRDGLHAAAETVPGGSAYYRFLRELLEQTQPLLQRIRTNGLAGIEPAMLQPWLGIERQHTPWEKEQLAEALEQRTREQLTVYFTLVQCYAPDFERCLSGITSGNTDGSSSGRFRANGTPVPFERLSNADQLATYPETIRVFEILMHIEPLVFTITVADLYCHFGYGLSQAKRWQEAVDAGEKGLACFQRIAPEKQRLRDAFSMASLYLAMGYRYSELKNGEASCRYSEEACNLFRRFCRDIPDSSLECWLADALDKTGIRLMRAKRAAEAIAASREAVTLYRQLHSGTARRAARGDGAFYPGLFATETAQALDNLAYKLGVVKQYEEAILFRQQAIHIYEKQESAKPGTYLEKLASAWMFLTDDFIRCGKPEEALLSGNRSAVYYRQVIPRIPKRNVPSLAILLLNLGRCSFQLNKPEDTQQQVAEAIQLFGPLAEQDASGYYYVDYLAGAQTLYARALLACNKPEAAHEVAKSAAETRLRLVKAHPGYYREEAHESVTVCLEVLKTLGLIDAYHEMEQKQVKL